MPLFKGIAKNVIKLHTKRGSKALKALIKEDFSSTHAKLKNTPLQLEGWDQERIIESVVDLGGNQRKINFTDGTTIAATPQFLHERAQKVGGTKHIEKVVTQGEKVTLNAALKALERSRRSYETGFLNSTWTDNQIRTEHMRHMRQIKETGAKVLPYVLVRSEGLLTPVSKKYADVLIKAGRATLDKGQ